MWFEPHVSGLIGGIIGGSIGVLGGIWPGVKFCVSVFRQSQEWLWKAGRILARIPW